MPGHNGALSGHQPVTTTPTFALPTMHNPLDHYLRNEDAAGRVIAHGRLILKLSRRFEALAPAGIRHAVRVVNYKSGKVVIHTENGAAAVRIRQMSQRLCAELSKTGLECSEIDVKVQPRPVPRTIERDAPPPLSGKSCNTLREAARKLPAGPLRQALDRLIERAANTEKDSAE